MQTPLPVAEFRLREAIKGPPESAGLFFCPFRDEQDCSPK
jgi:hypothetical protein